MTTTPTGIPIRDCNECGHRHPITRKHCPSCGHTMTATGRTVHANVQRYEHLHCPNCGAHARGTTRLKNPTRTRSAR